MRGRRFKVEKLLGSGGFASVYLVQELAAGGARYALKRIVIHDAHHQAEVPSIVLWYSAAQRRSRTPGHRNAQVMKEIRAMRTYSAHPNLVTLVCSDIGRSARTGETEALLITECVGVPLLLLPLPRSHRLRHNTQVLPGRVSV